MPLESVIQLVTDLGAFGFIMYLVHRTQTHTIPNLASAFEKSLEKQRQDFKETISMQREDFVKMLTREQDLHMQQTDRLVRGVEVLTHEVRSGQHPGPGSS